MKAFEECWSRSVWERESVGVGAEYGSLSRVWESGRSMGVGAEYRSLSGVWELCPHPILPHTAPPKPAYSSTPTLRTYGAAGGVGAGWKLNAAE